MVARFLPLMSRVAALAAALLLAACGGSDEPAPASGAVTVDSARTARASIGPAGGSVSATAADGRRYTLTVPAGALGAATEISATPVTSMGDAPLAAGTRAAVRFGPSGLKFTIPATLRIEGVAAPVASGKRRVGFVRSDDGARLQRLPAGTVDGALELPVPHFSDVGVADASAAELALVPLTTPETVTEEIWQAVDRRLDALPVSFTVNDIAAVLSAVIDDIVTPLQTAAAASTEAEVRESGVSAFADVARVIELGVNPQDLPQLLALMGGRVERVRAAAGALMTADFEAGLAGCASPGPADLIHLRGLNAAAAVTVLLPGYDLSPGRIGLGLQAPTLLPALGLDVETLRRRLNDCARVVFVPQPLPTFEVGRSVSLDQKAALVFAIDATQEVAQPFEFTVLGTDADVARASGLSDTLGFFTTVVTSRAAQPQFGTRACYVAKLRNGAAVSSELCGTQTLPQTTDVILAGTAKLFSFGTDPANPEGVSQMGEVALRVRVAADNSLTVTQALGQYSGRFVSRQRCLRRDGTQTAEVALTTTFSGSISDGSVAFPIVEVRAREVVSRERFSDDGSCTVVTATTATDVTQQLVIVAQQRNASGAIVALELNSFGQPSGHLVKE